jgi:hypothetical protein
MKPATLALIQSGSAKKGDVLGIARIAAIQAAKRTSDLIPLCHPIALTRVSADFTIDAAENAVHCTVTAECHGRTGIEMEALTATSVGLLTDLRHVQGCRPWHAHREHPPAGKVGRQVGPLGRHGFSSRFLTHHRTCPMR